MSARETDREPVRAEPLQLSVDRRRGRGRLRGRRRSSDRGRRRPAFLTVVRLPARRGREPRLRRARRDRRRGRRRLRAVLGHGPGRRPAPGAIPRGRAALRLRRARARDRSASSSSIPVINTLLLSFKDANGQDFVGLDNYRFVFTRPQHAAGRSATPRGWVILVPLVAVSIGLVVRHAGRPAAPRRGRREVVDLPADGDLVRRGRRSRSASIYSYRPQGFGTQHRAAERDHARRSARTRCRGSSCSRGTTCCSW